MFLEGKKRGIPWPGEEIRRQRGGTLLSAIFFLVIVALFGILAIKLISGSSVSSAEEYRYVQAGYAALAARELRIINLDRGSGGWDGTSTLNIGGCSSTQIMGATNASSDNGTIMFRVKGSCSSEGEDVSRAWEAVFRK